MSNGEHVNLNYCQVCGTWLGMDDYDGICVKCDTEDTAPCVPDDVLEAMQTLTYLAIEMADEVWIFHDETEMHALDSGVRWAAQTVRAWIESAKGGDE